MKKNQIILIIIGVLILILIGLTSYFIYLQKIIKSGVEAPDGRNPDLCTKFSGIPDEITCQKARELVLEKYPGEIKYIKRKKADLPEGILPDVTMVRKEVWLIGINLNPPMELDERELKGMEIFVTRSEGKLKINKIVSEKL